MEPDDVRELFREFDAQFFGGSLGEVCLDFGHLGDTMVFAGYFKSRKTIVIDLDQTEETPVDGSLLHEMVHAYEHLHPNDVEITDEARALAANPVVALHAHCRGEGVGVAGVMA